MSDEYLWDKTGEPDEETAKLERALNENRWQGTLPDDDAMRRAASAGTRRAHPLQMAAALIVVALIAWGVWWQVIPRTGTSGGSGAPGDTLPAYRFETLAGSPVIENGIGPLDAEQLLAGQRLVTDATSRARVVVGDIGSVTVEPDTRLRVETVAAKAETDAEHLLYLERGTMRASIFAAPRLFQLGTPSGIAVDMGCVYSATVDDDGNTWLAVDVGVVSFEADAREVTVPSGASTRAYPGRGPGTPIWDDAPDSYRDAIARLDEGEGTTLDIHEMIQLNDVDHTLALWHLLDHDDETVVHGAMEALLMLSPPPAGITEHEVRAGDPGALSEWNASFDWSWGETTKASGKMGG
jgi:hypothetical protein